MLKTLFYLYSVHLLRMILPFAAFPIVARTLDQRQLAEFLICTNTTLAVAAVVEFGYGLTAVQSIASAGSISKSRQIVQDVESGKIFVTLVVVAVCMAVGFWRGLLGINFIMAVMSGMISGLTPYYYKQGTGDFKIIALHELVSNLIYYGIGLALVLIWPAASPLVAAYLLSRIYVRWRIQHRFAGLIKVSICQGVRSAVENLIFFMHRSAQIVYSYAAIFLIASMKGERSVVMYSLAEKIVLALSGMGQPLLQLGMQNFSARQGSNYSINMVFCVAMALSLGIAVALCVHSEVVYSIFYGMAAAPQHRLMKVFAFFVPIKIFSSYVATRYFLSTNLKRVFANVFVAYSLLSFAGATMLLNHYELEAFVEYLVISESLFVLFLLYLRHVAAKLD